MQLAYKWNARLCNLARLGQKEGKVYKAFLIEKLWVIGLFEDGIEETVDFLNQPVIVWKLMVPSKVLNNLNGRAKVGHLIVHLLDLLISVSRWRLLIISEIVALVLID